MDTAFFALALAGGLLGAALPAGAQGVPSLGSSAQQAAHMATANIARLHLANGPAAPAKAGAKAPAPAKALAAPAGAGPHPAAARGYGYVPTEALRQETVCRAVANAQDTHPAGARIIADYFGTSHHAYQPYYDQARRRTALPDNDAAAAMAVYLLAGYLIINNYRTDHTTPAQAQGVRAQVAAQATANPRFAPPALAQTGEDMKLQTVLLTTGWQQSIQAGTSDAYRRHTAAYFTDHFNRDFARTQLTSQGFVAR